MDPDKEGKMRKILHMKGWNPEQKLKVAVSICCSLHRQEYIQDKVWTHYYVICEHVLRKQWEHHLPDEQSVTQHSDGFHCAKQHTEVKDIGQIHSWWQKYNFNMRNEKQN